MSDAPVADLGSGDPTPVTSLWQRQLLGFAVATAVGWTATHPSGQSVIFSTSW